ncbi:MAG: hypothetical protein ACT4OK_10340 [Gemmobacter sp.]
MARLALILLTAFVVAVVVFRWHDRNEVAPRRSPMAEDLVALRLQATDLQRSVETLARSPDPDPAELAALAARLEALTRSLEAIEGQTGR